MPETGLGNLIYYVALGSIFFIGLIAGGAIIFFARRMMINRQLRVAQRKASRTVAEANDQAKELLREARVEIEKAQHAANENEARQRRSELQRQENRVISKSENLDRKLESLEQRERNLNNKEKNIETIRGSGGNAGKAGQTTRNCFRNVDRGSSRHLDGKGRRGTAR